jgi:protein-S-isoprenylcysteine O-methyltransferase Ste14
MAQVSDPGTQDRQREGMDWGRACAVAVFTCFLILNVSGAIRDVGSGRRSVTGWIATLLTITFYLLLSIAYVRRSRSRVTDRDWTAWLAAFAATAAPFTVPFVAPTLRPDGPLATGASVVLVVGLAFMVWALRHLGTNISVVPQARAVVTTGPYAWVRHPLYAAELGSAVGLCLSRGSWAVWLVFVAMCALQYFRAGREEALLSRELVGYDDYQRSTPMLVPRPPR